MSATEPFGEPMPDPDLVGAPPASGTDWWDGVLAGCLIVVVVAVCVAVAVIAR